MKAWSFLSTLIPRNPQFHWLLLAFKAVHPYSTAQTSFWVLPIWLLIGFATQTLATENVRYESISELRSYIQQQMNNYFQDRHPDLTIGETLIVNTGSIDPRLQLMKCQTKPLLNVKTPALNSMRATVKTSCEDSARWTIYVPIQIQTFQNVVVAARNMPRGTLITKNDIKLQRMNTAKIIGAYVTDPSKLIGLEIKRPVRMMNIVKLNQAKQPDVISRGETVILRVKSTMLTVETEGTALSNGHLGEKIRVRNEKSRRIIDGLVTGPGEVQVAQW